MKKLLTVLLIGTSLFSFAQSFQLTNPKGTPYTNGETLFATITEDNLDYLNEYVTEILVKNITDNAIEVSILRTNLDLVDGMGAYVCFGVCAADSIFLLSSIIGEDAEHFTLHLKPNGNFGESKFQLDFMAPDDTITLFVNITMESLKVKEQNNEKLSLNASPNPVQAGSKLNIAYTIPTKNNVHKLVIRNFLGAEVMNMPLNPNENSIVVNTTYLVSGIYFYAIESNNQISIAKKLVIK
jgi:hypothetical protein